MLYYLDTNIVIYAIEGQPAIKQRARDYLAALESAGHRLIVGALTWTECLVVPMRINNGPLLHDYHRFFLSSNLTTISATASVYVRAAMIRAVHGHGLADSLHLAIAIENRVDRFLTNDQRLAGFPDLMVEVLP